MWLYYRHHKGSNDELPFGSLVALGVNFGFTEPDPSTDLIQNFDIRDSGALAENGLHARRTVITREIKWEHALLKLRMAYAGAQVSFHFNYTYAITSAGAGEELLSGKISACRTKTGEILSTIFELEAEGV
jgi:hypothetical protein